MAVHYLNKAKEVIILENKSSEVQSKEKLEQSIEHKEWSTGQVFITGGMVICMLFMLGYAIMGVLK